MLQNPMAFRIRDIELPRDRDAAVSFIHGLQLHEHAFEKDRRVDDSVAGEYFDVLMERVTKNGGRMFIAEEEGRAVGWAVFIVEEGYLYVVEAERTQGYIAELYLDESVRGRGAGRALIEACEDEARRRGLSHIKIGVLSGNRNAAEMYGRAGYAPYSAALRKYL
jgi:GNAT superfamily N-acetyltransferase